MGVGDKGVRPSWIGTYVSWIRLKKWEKPEGAVYRQEAVIRYWSRVPMHYGLLSPYRTSFGRYPYIHRYRPIQKVYRVRRVHP
jgi:hypothetical protein